jgi:Domain of unknown function (DUF4190)
VNEDRNGSRETDWNAWAVPARRPSAGTAGPPPPAPPPPPPGAPGQQGQWGPPPPPSYPGQWGGPPPYGPAPYGGGYGNPSPYGGWGSPAHTNGLAIAGMVCGILWLYWIGSILALVFGYVAKSQIDKSHGTQTGRGMAVAGIVLGWIGVGFLALVVVLSILSAATSSSGSSSF